MKQKSFFNIFFIFLFVKSPRSKYSNLNAQKIIFFYSNWVQPTPTCKFNRALHQTAVISILPFHKSTGTRTGKYQRSIVAQDTGSSKENGSNGRVSYCPPFISQGPYGILKIDR